MRAFAIAWRDKEFKNKLIDENANPLDALKDKFDYECPFDVTLKIKETHALNETHHFNPICTGGWIGANNKVTLQIPPAPRDLGERARALAAFNEENLLFLRMKQRPVRPPGE